MNRTSVLRFGLVVVRESLSARRPLCSAASLPNVEPCEDDHHNESKKAYDDLKYTVGQQDRIRAPVKTRARREAPTKPTDCEVPGMVDLEKKQQTELEERHAHFNSAFSKKLLRLANYYSETDDDDHLVHTSGQRSSKENERLEGDVFHDERHNFSDNAYNHGLSGQGKRSYDRWEKSPQMSLQGEVLFGLFPCLLALQTSRRSIYQVFVRPGFVSESENSVKRELLELVEEQNVRVRVRNKEALFGLSQSRPHQGVCMDVSAMQSVPLDLTDLHDCSALSSVKSSQPQVWVVLDQVQDPMNFGAILRSCYYLGVDRVIVSATDSCALSPVVSKASAGVLEILPVHGVPDIAQLLEEGQRAGWAVVGTAGQGATPLHDYTLSSDTLLLLGNEGRGVSDVLRAHCDRLLSVPPGRPLHPHVDSLNVSVATALVLSHLTAGRGR